jgi:hypothetical protein
MDGKFFPFLASPERGMRSQGIEREKNFRSGRKLRKRHGTCILLGPWLRVRAAKNQKRNLMRPHPLGLLVAASLALATPALATTISLSSVSSDATPASLLDADFDFSVSGSTLTLTVSNTGSDFNINQIYFNASGLVSSLSLVSATHDVAGDVSAAWLPIELGSNADGFGSFAFALTDGVGQNNPNIIEPGEEIVFVFSITGSGGYTDADFIVANDSGYTAAAKFVNGPPDPECAGVTEATEQCPELADTEDSAFGAVPEPLVGWLLMIGLGGLVAAGRKPS